MISSLPTSKQLTKRVYKPDADLSNIPNESAWSEASQPCRRKKGDLGIEASGIQRVGEQFIMRWAYYLHITGTFAFNLIDSTANRTQVFQARRSDTSEIAIRMT